MPEMTLLDFLKIIGGGVVGAVTTHLFTGGRDKRNRLAVFLGFLRQWRSEGTRTDSRDVEKVWAAYISGVSRFYNELGRIEMDFRKDERFLELAAKIGEVEYKDVAEHKATKGTRHDPITGRIDLLLGHITKGWYNFTKAASTL